MSLSTELIDIRNHFVGETHHVLSFIRMSEVALKRREAKLKNPNFDKKDIKEAEKLHSFMGNFINGKPNKSDSITLNSEKLKKLLIGSIITPIKHKIILAEMSLSYLVSFEEAFLKDYLRAILSSRRTLLMSKKKQLSYEVICKHRSMASLIRSLSQKEVDTFGFGSIDDFAKYFFDKFNIDFGIFSHWEDLREATYRRHLLVHNNGITNDRYCRATGFKETNKHLDTDIYYCITAGKILLEFMNFIHERMMKKLKLSKKGKKVSKSHRGN